MFGKRRTPDDAPTGTAHDAVRAARQVPETAKVPDRVSPETNVSAPARIHPARKSDEYYELKTQVFAALIEAIDVSKLARMDAAQARNEIRDIVGDIIAAKRVV